MNKVFFISQETLVHILQNIYLFPTKYVMVPVSLNDNQVLLVIKYVKFCIPGPMVEINQAYFNARSRDELKHVSDSYSFVE